MGHKISFIWMGKDTITEFNPGSSLSGIMSYLGKLHKLWKHEPIVLFAKRRHWSLVNSNHTSVGWCTWEKSQLAKVSTTTSTLQTRTNAVSSCLLLFFIHYFLLLFKYQKMWVISVKPYVMKRFGMESQECCKRRKMLKNKLMNKKFAK